MDRRSFISKTTIGISSVALSYSSPLFNKDEFTDSKNNSEKKLLATTDYSDNILVNNSFMDKANLNELHAYLASLGVTRHQWIVDTNWTFYDNYPHGFDLLKEAVKSAHLHGIEFYAIIKPFEECGFRPVLPHTLPFPEGAVAFKDLRGIKPWASSFAAQNVEMNLKRRPGTYEFHGPVSSIRLVKNNSKLTNIKPNQLSIFTSPTNNGFVKYDGPISFRETVEWRPGFPKWKECRILHLEDLKLPTDHRHILIRSSADKSDDFSNEIAKIIEPVGPNGKIIPCTHSTGPGSFKTDEARFFKRMVVDNLNLVPYLNLPEVKKELNDPQKMQKHYHNFYNFERYNVTNTKSLNKDGYIAVVCGKPEYLLGNLHPIYPEVRKHWLDITRFCLDRGVDGINYRVQNHSQDPEYWEYGFNAPVLEASGGSDNYPTIKRINGDAYTTFLREARTLIKERGKSMTVHIFSQMLAPDDRRGRLSYLPPNFEWQWEKWVNEIADDLEYRGVYSLQPWHAKQVLETILDVTRKANKNLYFQGKHHEVSFKGPNNRTREELEMIHNYAGIDGFSLYETASFTRLNKKGEIEGSPEIKKVIKNLFFNQTK